MLPAPETPETRDTDVEMLTANSLTKPCVTAGVLEVSRMARPAAAPPVTRTCFLVHPGVRTPRWFKVL